MIIEEMKGTSMIELQVQGPCLPHMLVPLEVKPLQRVHGKDHQPRSQSQQGTNVAGKLVLSQCQLLRMRKIRVYLSIPLLKQMTTIEIGVYHLPLVQKWQREGQYLILLLPGKFQGTKFLDLNQHRRADLIHYCPFLQWS